jgi:tRNA-dihydrouridine synthase B
MKTTDRAPEANAFRLEIGPLKLDNPFILAPMAGVTDRPFRNLCRRFGAAMAVSEMVSANPLLKDDRKTLMRTDHGGETGIRAVQILGNEPKDMAEAARLNEARGAHLIDINMGCPAKKVCKKAAGSALLRDEDLVQRILEAVVSSVNVPVTLKIRTGWDPENRNAVRIGEIAEASGIKALTIHGRTRSCGFSGSAEYRTIAEVKRSIRIPVIANGDITTPEKAQAVLEATGADAVMVGRGALGQPWLFTSLNHHHAGSTASVQPKASELEALMLEHLESLYTFYGEFQGVRIARKHMGWYFDRTEGPVNACATFNQQISAENQKALIRQLFREHPIGYRP